jgi:hypothetical protein
MGTEVVLSQLLVRNCSSSTAATFLLYHAHAEHDKIPILHPSEAWHGLRQTSNYLTQGGHQSTITRKPRVDLDPLAR